MGLVGIAVQAGTFNTSVAACASCRHMLCWVTWVLAQGEISRGTQAT
jgi:hypothetical protein